MDCATHRARAVTLTTPFLTPNSWAFHVDVPAPRYDFLVVVRRRVALSWSSAVLASGAALLIASPARAEGTSIDFQASWQVGGAYLRKVPALTMGEVATPARSLARQEITTGGSLVGLGGAVDTSFTVNGRWFVPLAGVGLYAAVGTYDTVRTTVDGSIAYYRPWSTWQGDLLLPGLGRRFTRRRWMFAADVRLGASFLVGRGSVADGATSTRLELTGASFAVLAEVEACRRLDPENRVCLQVAPRLYDFGAINGGTFGLRWEIGR
ncbi:MAG: hypothetical protein JWP97_5830 [Labilithrix sp.]|nr:hypothetical protein [Labilithrix sp.]